MIYGKSEIEKLAGYNYCFYEDDRKNLAYAVLERHGREDALNYVLPFCYHDLYRNYGKIIPTIDRDESIKVNNMGIMFTEDIDDDYLEEIKKIFEDQDFSIIRSGSYIYGFDIANNTNNRYYDLPYYSKFGKVNVKAIREKYQNLDLKTIRYVIMYSKNDDYREKLFQFLNSKDIEIQYKVCELIRPISIEVAQDNCIDKSFDGRKNQFIDLVLSLMNNENIKKTRIYSNAKVFDHRSNLESNEANTGKEFYGLKKDFKRDKIIDQMDSIYMSIIDNDDLITKNVFYITEFENLFQDLLVNNISKINDKNIDILLRSKEFSLKNIPEATGEIFDEEPILEYSMEEDDYVHSIFGGFVATSSYEVEHKIGFELTNTIDYKEKDVLKQKKTVIEILGMLFDDNIDYKKLFKLGCGDYGSQMMDYVNDNNNEKVKVLCK